MVSWITNPDIAFLQAKRVLTRIEFTTLRHVTTLVEIIYDPNPADTVVEEDKYASRASYSAGVCAIRKCDGVQNIGRVM